MIRGLSFVVSIILLSPLFSEEITESQNSSLEPLWSGNFEKVEQEITQKSEANPALLLSLAELFFYEGNWTQLEGVLLRLPPDRETCSLALVTALHKGDVQAANEIATKLQSLLSEQEPSQEVPQEPFLAALRSRTRLILPPEAALAQWALENNHPLEALEWYKKILAPSTTSLVALGDLASLCGLYSVALDAYMQGSKVLTQSAPFLSPDEEGALSQRCAAGIIEAHTDLRNYPAAEAAYLSLPGNLRAQPALLLAISRFYTATHRYGDLLPLINNDELCNTYIDLGIYRIKALIHVGKTSLAEAMANKLLNDERCTFVQKLQISQHLLLLGDANSANDMAATYKNTAFRSLDVSLAMGHLLKDMCRYDTLLSLWDRQAYLVANYPQAWVLKAQGLWGLSQNMDATKAALQALQLAPGYPPAYDYLESEGIDSDWLKKRLADLTSQVLSAPSAPPFADTIALAKLLFRLSQPPHSLIPGCEQNDIKFSSGKLERVLDNLTDTYSLYPELFYAHGLTYLITDHPGDAEIAFKKAIALDPTYAEPLCQLALLAASKKLLYDATQYMQQATFYNPTNLLCRIIDGNIAMATQDLYEARVAWERASIIRQNDISLLLPLANVLYDLKNIELALETLLKANSIRPNSREILIALVVVLNDPLWNQSFYDMDVVVRDRREMMEKLQRLYPEDAKKFQEAQKPPSSSNNSSFVNEQSKESGPNSAS